MKIKNKNDNQKTPPKEGLGRSTIITISVFTVAILGLAFFLPKRDTTGGTIAITDGENGHQNPENQWFNTSDVANQLYTIMGRAWWGASAEILAVFVDRVPRNNTAFEQLKNAFGLRQHNGYTGGTSFGSDKNLIQWLKAELNKEHYQTNQAWI